MKKFFALAAVATLVALPAAAQDVVNDADCVGSGCELQITTSITVPTLMKAWFSGVNQYGNPLNPTMADFEAGFRAEEDGPGFPRPKVLVQSNVPWKLSIKALSSTFGYAGSYDNPNKPAGDMEVKPGRGQSINWFSLSTTDQTFATGNATGPANHVASVDQKVKWTWGTDKPGTYTIGLQLTLASQ